MGRPERPLDPEAGPVQRFAHDLRELRKTAGTPAYRIMSESAGFSATTLSEAARGERLPSLAVVQGYVRACGADPAGWERRWKEAESAAATRADTEDAVPPYRGLARFEGDDHALFFGRDRLAEELLELVRGHRFAVLFGASGSGKSSLLRAGLLPRLREETARQDCPAALRVFTPGARPAATHRHLLAPRRGEPESWVVVDQFEEVFTLCRSRAERTRFLDLLLAAREPDSRLRVLIAVRADFYARCAEHRGLATVLSGASLLVGPMTADELRETVVRPAQAAGLLVERELTARIVEEVLGEPGALPMLSHALLETWRRRKGRLLTVAAYETVGGVRGAIAASAEEAYGRLDAAQARAARQLLLRMVEPGRVTVDTRRPLTRAELDEWADPAVRAVVEHLAEARLLTVDEDGVQLAHEALITSWPRLRGWIEEDRDRLRRRRQVAEAARVWLEHDRDPGALWRGARLDAAQELLTGDAGLTAQEQAFLREALEVREAERRAAAHATRRARVLTVALSGVLAVASVVGLVAWQQHTDNQRQRTDTAARRVAAVADAMRTTDPRTAQLLGVAAWRISPLPESRRALLGALAQPELDTFTDPAVGEGHRRFLVDSGRTLLSTDGRTWHSWDVAAHRDTGSGRLPRGRVVAVGPDARVLALAGGAGIRLWDRADGHWRGAAHPGASGVTVTGRGGYVLRGAGDGRVGVISAVDGTTLFETRSDGTAGVTASADGRLVAVCPSGRAPRVWDTARRRPVPGPWERAGGDCRTLVLGDDRLALLSSKGVRIWETSTGDELAEVDHPGARYAAFSRAEDGAFLATADGEEIRVWRLSAPGSPAFRHPLNNQQLYGGLAWDPYRPVLRYLEGSTVHSLDLAGAVTSAWRERPVDGLLLSPDGRMLATAQRFGTTYRFQLRDTRDELPPIPLPPPPLPVARDPERPVPAHRTLPVMAFSPDGTSFAYGVSAPGRQTSPQHLTVWDMERLRVRSTLDPATSGSGAAVVGMALGPDGRTLYTTRRLGSGAFVNEAWDTERRRRTAVLTGLASGHLAVHPDGRLLVGDNRLVRPPATATTERDLVQGDRIGALAFGPDGSRLAAGDRTGRVALWDGALGHRTGVLRNIFPAPIGATPEAVSALAVSPDGQTLAVAGTAGTLQLWDTATQQPLGSPLPTSGEELRTLAFSPDSGTLYAGSAHVPLQRYTIDPSWAVLRVCARAGAGTDEARPAGAGLDEARWRTYVPDAPYRRICDRSDPVPEPDADPTASSGGLAVSAVTRSSSVPNRRSKASELVGGSASGRRT
ncbi:WD-40 repeat protein [Streptomyces lincolnensis]|uniref:WD-40 repeat protein n=1 Tax=Streptomyces lincolnensis TaxID=1915 RepID=A0A1B1M375_STRLN|nr:WD-40 repeat protein [Streptomyces lincolnensis]AXG52020.1 WD-40 repeat protein [Streptomyces lincolnensis]